MVLFISFLVFQSVIKVLILDLFQLFFQPFSDFLFYQIYHFTSERKDVNRQAGISYLYLMHFQHFQQSSDGSDPCSRD